MNYAVPVDKHGMNLTFFDRARAALAKSCDLNELKSIRDRACLRSPAANGGDSAAASGLIQESAGAKSLTSRHQVRCAATIWPSSIKCTDTAVY